MGEIYLIGLTSEKECAVAAFDDGDFPTYKEIVDVRLVDQALLLELVDGEATRAASGRPMMAAP